MSLSKDMFATIKQPLIIVLLLMSRKSLSSLRHLCLQYTSLGNTCICVRLPIFRGCGVNSCPLWETKMDNSRFYRPVSIQPVSDSATFQQVRETGEDRESMLSESCPRWSSKSPTTLNVFAHLRTGLGWLIG